VTVSFRAVFSHNGQGFRTNNKLLKLYKLEFIIGEIVGDKIISRAKFNWREILALGGRREMWVEILCCLVFYKLFRLYLGDDVNDFVDVDCSHSDICFTVAARFNLSLIP
jgi:hypothetical protein